MYHRQRSPQSILDYRTPDGSVEDHDDNDLLDIFMRQRAVRQAWDGLFDNDNHLLFGLNPGMDAVARSALHPPLAHILRLWQVYLDNVNPLIKVTHAPSLQARVIEAAANLQGMDAHLEALLFGIYCMATSSLTEEECLSILAMPKMDALTRFQRGCQQSLLSCRFLQTVDRECLTAYLLYLVSQIAPGGITDMAHSSLADIHVVFHAPGNESPISLSHDWHRCPDRATNGPAQ